MKYSGLFALSVPLAQKMIQCWPQWAHTPEIIIPVPLHPRRQRIRGFNQSMLLAQQLAPEIGIELNSQALERVRHTRPQVDLTPQRRLENVQDAFSADSHAIKGKSILLLDDVFTTGATMNSAASALLKAGASHVSAYCLARTVE
jgi:ComF family protein